MSSMYSEIIYEKYFEEGLELGLTEERAEQYAIEKFDEFEYLVRL